MFARENDFIETLNQILREQQRSAYLPGGPSLDF